MNAFRRTSVCIALVAIMSIMVATPASADVSNGGFEIPVVPPNTFQQFTTGQSIGAWTVRQENVDLIGAGFWQAADGVQSLDLDGSAVRGAASQTISTLPLFKYQVSFALAGNPDLGPTIKTGQVLVNGHVVKDFSFDITGKSRANMGYVHKEATFLATGWSATLTFASTTGSGYGPVIDKVRVESCLLIICLG